MNMSKKIVVVTGREYLIKADISIINKITMYDQGHITIADSADNINIENIIIKEVPSVTIFSAEYDAMPNASAYPLHGKDPNKVFGSKKNKKAYRSKN